MSIIVLEHPRLRSEKHFNDIANTPLWSCLMGGYAATNLKAAGFEVDYLDANHRAWDFDHTAEEVLHRRPDLLCLHAVYFWEHTGRLFDFLAQLRSVDYHGHINLFGFFPSLAWQAVLPALNAVDSIAVGECEDTLAALARRLERGRPWQDTPGLAGRSLGGVPTLNRRPPAPDPDRFAFPEQTAAAGDTATILASRGCYNQCSFCPVPVFYNGGPLWRGRSTANVLAEISALMDRGVRDFYFADPNFIGPGPKNRRRTLELAHGLRDLNITYGMETRANDLDRELLGHLADAGLQSLLLGLESGSPEVLKRLNKGASLNASEQALVLCRAAGIEPEVGFLMFVPDSSLADLEHNLAFLLRNNLLDRLERSANLLSHSQIVLMGTSGYQRFEAEKRLRPNGPLGFEGEISYRDPRVKWVAELVVHACHYVLQEMSRADSAIFWRTIENDAGEEKPGVRQVNDHLVDLFGLLLKEAQGATHLPPVDGLKAEVEKGLRAVISRVGRKECK